MKSLSKSDIKQINSKLEEKYGISPLHKKDRVQLVEDEMSYLMVNNEIMFIYLNDELIPTIKTLMKENFLKQIVVDMGSIKFLTGGADLMRPGIVEIPDGIKEGDVISCVDENNKRVLIIGVAMFNSEEMRAKDSGKVVKNIHYVGDDIWKL
ncbi:DUF1947 domain-containing protein [Nanoarchaeota archaeon]